MDERAPRKTRGRRWIFAGYVRKAVLVSIALELIVFGVYLAGSLPDPGFSDQSLFLLLRALQYLSLLLCAFSLCALALSVHRLVHYPGVRSALILCFYFVTGVAGAGFAMLNSMIIAVAGGTG